MYLSKTQKEEEFFSGKYTRYVRHITALGSDVDSRTHIPHENFHKSSEICTEKRNIKMLQNWNDHISVTPCTCCNMFK
jgi:hypothetical protein